MLHKVEFEYRQFIRRMSGVLAGDPLVMEPSVVKPSQVGGIEKKLKNTGVSQAFQGVGEELTNLLRGASTIGNYIKASGVFVIQNDLLEKFCKLLTIQTLSSCGIIMGPSKKETSALKKYWDGGKEASGFQGAFKDLCRCTLVCYDKSIYPQLPVMIRSELTNSCYLGKWRILDDGGKPGAKVRVRDDSKPDDLGYTDTNITLTLPNGARIEVQVNIQATLYGKMGRPAFMEEACPPGQGEGDYVAMERKKRLPGGCGHVLYELYKEYDKGKKCNMSKDEVRNLSRDYYDHLSGLRTDPQPVKIVERLTELSKSDIWKATYEHTAKDNPRNLPAFVPGHKWEVGLRE
jgi:hypothetical protein